jgi:superfamily II DNA or RNA helicase
LKISAFVLAASAARIRLLVEGCEFMPAYRFRWENLPKWLLDDVIEATGCRTLVRLRREWGSLPGEQLVTRCRDVLTTKWLSQDEAARRSVVEALRKHHLGAHSQRPRSKRGELSYIASCRSGKKFSQVLFLELVRLGEIPAVAITENAAEGDTKRRPWRRVSTAGDPPQFQPHRHQEEAWQALDAATPIKGGILVMPTGAGKTVTAVRWILKNVLSGSKPKPVLWLAHRSELLDQAADTFAKHAPIAEREQPVGIRCISTAHGNRAQTMLQSADVVCATVASLRQGPEVVSEYFVRHPDAFVVIDEAHHAAAKSYQTLIAAARKSRHVQILGLTATPTRTIEGEIGLLRRAFPQGILFSVEASRLIAEGFLARPICESVITGCNFEADFTPADIRHLRTFGELSENTLKHLAADMARNALIANRYQQFRQLYGQTLVFAANIPHCYTLADELRKRGVRADYVGYNRNDSGAVLDDFKQEELDVLLTVTKLTEGVDLPSITTVFLARPTGSRILLSQMVGRGMRGPVAKGAVDVRIVSFDDHWERFSDWLDPVEFLDAPITDRPDREPVRRELVDVPWEVYLRIAQMVRQDPGLVDGVVNRPVGWLDLSLLPEQSEGFRTILVFHHQRDGYEALLDDIGAGRGAGEPATLINRYFGAIGQQPSIRVVESILRFADEIGRAPSFYRFDFMDTFGPEAVASQIAALSVSEATEEINRHYDSQPMVAALFPDRRMYADAVFAALLDRHSFSKGFTEHTVVDLAERLEGLPEGDFDLAAIARRVSERMSLSVDIPDDIDWDRSTKRSYWAMYYRNPVKIRVNPVLKTSAIREETMEFLVYHELLHHELGVAHSHEFRNREHEFSNWFDADAELDTLKERFVVPIAGRVV